MDMALALHNLLMVRHEDIAADIKSQAFAILGKDRPKERWPATDERRVRHEALMALHYALRKYRRMWDQPTRPLTRKLVLGESYVRASFLAVCDGLLECLPYMSQEGPVGEVLKVRGKLPRAWHFLYLRDILERIVANDPQKQVEASDKALACAVQGGVRFTLHRFFSQVNFSDVIGQYEVKVEAGRIGFTIAEELSYLQQARDIAGPEFLKVCRNPGMWEPRVPVIAHKWMAEGRRAGLPPFKPAVEKETANTSAGELELTVA